MVPTETLLPTETVLPTDPETKVEETIVTETIVKEPGKPAEVTTEEIKITEP